MTVTPEGDNRWTAVLSTDLLGFTEISQAIGAERVYALLTVVLGKARKAIEDHGGHVVDTAGDGILAVFGAPQALENASLAACRAALAFHAALERDLPGLEADFGTQIRFRTGIAAGNTLVALTGDGGIKVVGAAVNLVARLQELAMQDETLISEPVRRDAEGHLETLDIGQVALKGFSERVQVHKLLALVETLTKFDATRRRGMTDFVGRRTEFERILTGLRAEDGPNVVLLRGPAGIGKSRLAHEVIAAQFRHALLGQCQPLTAPIAYQPFTDMLRQAAGPPQGTDPEDVLSRLLDRYADLKADHEDHRPDDVGLNQGDHALRIRALYLALLQRIGASTPGLFVIEDLHWIDPASSALLARLVESDTHLLLTARNGFSADWLVRDNVLVVDLPPLGNQDIARIAQLTIAQSISPRVEAFVTDRAEGNPLVAEEVSRALLEDCHLGIVGDHAELKGDPGPFVTGQLEQLVLARVDRLNPDQQETIRHAAAIGRSFDTAELEAVLARSAALEDIAASQRLIEPDGPGRWRFVHALIRDAVHGSLLSARRQAIHLRVAETLELANRTDDSRSGLIADHFLQSSDPARAAAHLVRAAGHSLGTYALHKTDAFLDRAFDLESRTPGLLADSDYSDLTVHWLRAMDNMGDFGRCITLSERVLPRLEAKGYTPALGISRMQRTLALSHAWKYDEAHRLAQTTLEEAERHGDAWGAAWARVALMRIFDENKRADIEAIESLAAEVAPVAERTGDRHMAMTAQYLLSSAYRSAGFRRKALRQAERIEAYSVTNNDRRAMGYAKWARALVYAIEGDPERAFATIEDASDHVVPGSGDERVSLGLRYHCKVLMGDPEEVRDKIAALEAESARMVDRNIKGSMAYTDAIADLRTGALARGWRKLKALEAYVGPHGNINLLNQVHAARSEVLLTLAGLIDPTAEAPPDRPRIARRRPGVADLATFAWLRARALGLAERSIEASFALGRPDRNPHAARHRIGLGLIRMAQKKPQPARALLEEGLELAEGEGLGILARRARAALAQV